MNTKEILNQRELDLSKISLITLTLASAIYGLFITKNHFLDDTFIHLKIAKNILEKGIYSFNGIESDFSTSSPLYTTILSLGLRIWDNPYIAKILNIIFYFLDYSLISIFLLRTKNVNSLILSIFLVGISSPLGVRWLTDGMESSLVMLFSIIIGYLLYIIHQFKTKEYKKIFFLITYLFLTFSILLRIEFAFIIVWYIFACIISRSFSNAKSDYNNFILRLYPLFLSLITSFSFLYINFGSFTPDTSIAKGGLKYDLNFLIINVLRAHLSASIFGISLLLSLFISIYSIYKYRDILNLTNQTTFVYLINFSLPIFTFLILIKGQMIQGIRYFIFLETFLISFNLLICKGFDLKKLINKKINYKYKYLLYLLIPLLITPWLWNDFNALNRISEGRSQSFLNLSTQDLGCLNNKNLIAWDVGMISYFSKSFILDPNGLVNGRELAKLKEDDRLNQLVKKNKIDYAFVNDKQMKKIEKSIDLTYWINLGSYKFPNFKKNSQDIHYLLKNPNSESC